MMLMNRQHRALLIRLQVGGCTCMTKTNELKYHATDCQYRLASEIEEALTFEDDTISKTAPSAVALDDERKYTQADMERFGKAYADARDARCPVAQPVEQTAQSDFKNFHRLLCERFGYVHDEKDWQRDQLSLIEWIASRAIAQPVEQTRALTSNQFAAIRAGCASLQKHGGYAPFGIVLQDMLDQATAARPASGETE